MCRVHITDTCFVTFYSEKFNGALDSFPQCCLSHKVVFFFTSYFSSFMQHSCHLSVVLSFRFFFFCFVLCSRTTVIQMVLKSLILITASVVFHLFPTIKPLLELSICWDYKIRILTTITVSFAHFLSALLC